MGSLSEIFWQEQVGFPILLTLQLLPLLGDAQAQTLKGLTGDLARSPWQWQASPRHLPTQDEAVALISEGLISPRPVDDTPTPP